MKSWLTVLSLLSTLASVPVLATACSSSNDAPAAPPVTPPPPATDVDAGADAAEAAPPANPLPWVACPLHSEGDGPMAECATVKTPLDPKRPDGPSIDVFVKRFKPAGGKSLRQVWMLQGGPGGSGYVFENLAEQIATKFPDIDYYMPDHRGTGKSTRLGCPTQEAEGTEEGINISEAEWPACLADVQAKEGARLPFFTATNAANDLGLLIERARQPGQATFVYGVSYGTYLAHRYLQLFPKQADGVVFDSYVPPGTSLARQDADANEAAQDFFAVCGKDAFCMGKMGADPWAKAQALFAKLKTGYCPDIAIPELPTHVLLRRAFGQFLMDPALRVYIPAIVYRVDRCAANDVTALKQLVANLTQQQPAGEFAKQWGWILSNNITLSELWEDPSPTAAELSAIREASVASRDVTTNFDFQIGKWPTYPKDEYMGGWPTTDVPVLFLQGGLDPATLLRKAVVAKDHFNKPHQSFVEIPTATHTVIVSSATTANRSCGTRIMMNFIENPQAPLDTSCLPTVVPLDFQGQKPISQALLGTTDAWE
jgi:pimeloyl-ACP methyl ester carboxylesterase